MWNWCLSLLRVIEGVDISGIYKFRLYIYVYIYILGDIYIYTHIYIHTFLDKKPGRIHSKIVTMMNGRIMGGIFLIFGLFMTSKCVYNTC